MPVPDDNPGKVLPDDYAAAAGEASAEEKAVLRKVALRLIPFLFLLYVVNLLDRINIGFAKLRMLDDLKMDEAAYGLGAGLFYVGYLIFEVPSNLILTRVGARRWIARIAISWGVISSMMMFVRGPWSFYTLRVLLGVAEAGFFPGIILYMSQWFPARARARAVATFMIAGLVASMVGNPVSGAILQYMDGAAGLTGWQWVFLLEGIPSVALGFVALRYLTDRPDLAHWLTPGERGWLVRRMDAEQRELRGREGRDWWQAMLDPRVWLLIAIYFTVAVGDNVMGFFLPTFLKLQFPGLKEFHLGLLAALPPVLAVVAMVAVAHHSDRTGERRWHVAGSAFVAAVGWLLMAVAPSPWLFVAALVVALAGMKSMLPTFWTLPTSILGGTAAAAGIALINSVANLGGFFGPAAAGKLKAATGSFSTALLVVAAVLGIGGVLALCTGRARRPNEVVAPK
jgi:ACS family tartrate transporter-like MFS transporter